MKISTFYKLPATLIFSILLISFLPGTLHEQWYNNSWLFRKTITIGYTKVVTGPHTNPPMLTSRADAAQQTKAQTDADDILFTSADGTTKVDHEIESYTSLSGTTATYAIAGTLTVNSFSTLAPTAGTTTMSAVTSAIINNGTLAIYN